jgi:predicted nucleic acid-binding protein
LRFWDTSAIVPLLVKENSTAAMQSLYRSDSALFVWWGTEVECISAIARVEREGMVSTSIVFKVINRLKLLSERKIAKRFLRVHNLRAADALQLAAAFLAAEKDSSTLEFVCLDERLANAARKEGFAVIGI